jgi:hypothetical protein
MTAKCVNESEFINMMKLWTLKKGKYPAELLTFILSDDGYKLIALESYITGDLLYLGKRSYENYQTALRKFGALIDKMDYPLMLNTFKANHPMSCPEFCEGYDSKSNSNPYFEGSNQHNEWAAGKRFLTGEKLFEKKEPFNPYNKNSYEYIAYEAKRGKKKS